MMPDFMNRLPPSPACGRDSSRSLFCRIVPVEPPSPPAPLPPTGEGRGCSLRDSWVGTVGEGNQFVARISVSVIRGQRRHDEIFPQTTPAPIQAAALDGCTP
jgi:hypothetical protein